MEENEKIEEVQEQPQAEEQDLSMFETAEDPSVVKVNLDKPEGNDPQEPTVTRVEVNDEGVVGSNENSEPAQEQEEVQPQVEAQEQPTIEEVVEQEVVEQTNELAEEAQEAIVEAKETGEPLPENIQKLVEFINETGGDIEDYVRLNQDFSEMDNQTALREYYKQTKPHLDADEVQFLMEENFNYDEEVDDEKDIRKKKIALKEQVAEAKAYLDGQKSKYYDEIKAGSKLTPEQQKAMDFFNRYNKESEETKLKFEKEKSNFLKKTDNVFSNKFKGFEYNVGDKRFRFNIKDAGKVKEAQTDINNFVKKFLNKDGLMEDAAGYHKSLYTAMNADAIAKHFYEQGKADAIRETIAKDKNINTEARGAHNATQTGGMKFRVLGDDTDSFKFKIKSKNKK